MTHTPNTARTIDRNLLQFQAQAQVQAALDEINGTQVTRVTFLTKRGDLRTYAGMTNCHSRRVGGERGAIATQALKNAGNVWMDYPNAAARKDGKKGFSFNLGRVVAIGDKLGQHPPA